MKGVMQMPRKRRSTKSRIVKAAWNLFYKNGYDNTTVDDIIAASKTSKGTFYHYFKGKEALLNSLSNLFDGKYEELAAVIDPNLPAYDKLLFLNHELFYMIETSVDINLLASLYSSQLITKDKKSLVDKKRFYFEWITEILSDGLSSGEFKNTSSAEELMNLYAMYERALLYDWALFKGKYSLTEQSDKLIPHLLDTFVEGV
jgi:AcrR family transcriptional regulator